MIYQEERDSPEEIDLYRAVAQRIRAGRIRAGLTHAELAERVGMKKAYVFELERGTTNPTLKTLLRIASGLGIGPDQLLPGSTRLEIDQLTLDALLDLSATILKSIDGRRAAMEKAFQKEADAVRALHRVLDNVNKAAPRVGGSDTENQTEANGRSDKPSPKP